MGSLIKPGDPRFNGNPAKDIPVDPRPLVQISMPCGDDIKCDTMLSLVAVLFSCQPYARPALQTIQGSSISWLRNCLVETALKANADYVLFVDSDMTFPADALARLMNRNRAIVGATYTRKRPPYTVLGRALPDAGPLPPHGVVAVAGLPTGFLLVKTSVFRQMKRPWFVESYDYEGNPDNPFIGEDYGFCEKARALGISLWLDIDLSQHVGHIGANTLKLPPIDAMAPAPAEEPADG